MQGIADVQRRAQGYWFVDGLPEITGGVMMVACGALLYAAVATGAEWLGTLALGVLILAFPAAAWIVRALKERITYPRTGYVEYLPPSRARRFVAAAIGLVAAGVMVPLAAVAGGREASATVLSCGAAMGAIIALRAWRTGMPRFYISAAALIVFSAIISTSETLGVQDSIGLVIGFTGLVSIANGTWTLLRYLRVHRNEPGGAS
jgi:hypothetical protein